MEQLVYGSADQIAGRLVGGWGVLHTSGHPTGQTQRELLRLTSVALASTLPQFPSAQQLEQRTVRFRVTPHAGGLFACHSVEAGTDHTGRPGNVISHCALLPPDPTLRPVDWFFSSGWVRPYGPRQIAETRLPEELPRPDGWAATAAWLREEPSRTARIGWIADVAGMLLLTGQRLVLRSSSVAEAARWASVLSWLLNSERAAQVRIRIGEDAHTIGEQLVDAPVIVCVTGEMPSHALRGLPVLDTDWQLDAGEAAATGSWVLPTGQSFAASPLTGLATDLVFADTTVAAAVFAKRDELIARILTEGLRARIEHERLALQVAWLATAGAQPLARVEPIRHLLAELDPRVLAWDEVAALAAEVGEPASPEAHLDVYAIPDDPADPWQVDGPDPLTEALIGAAKLGAEGLDVETLLRNGTLTDHIEEHPAQRQPWLRAIATVLGTDQSTHLPGEER